MFQIFSINRNFCSIYMSKLKRNEIFIDFSLSKKNLTSNSIDVSIRRHFPSFVYIIILHRSERIIFTNLNKNNKNLSINNHQLTSMLDDIYYKTVPVMYQMYIVHSELVMVMDLHFQYMNYTVFDPVDNK